MSRQETPTQPNSDLFGLGNLSADSDNSSIVRPPGHSNKRARTDALANSSSAAGIAVPPYARPLATPANEVQELLTSSSSEGSSSSFYSSNSSSSSSSTSAEQVVGTSNPMAAPALPVRDEDLDPDIVTGNYENLEGEANDDDGEEDNDEDDDSDAGPHTKLTADLVRKNSVPETWTNEISEVIRGCETPIVAANLFGLVCVLAYQHVLEQPTTGGRDVNIMCAHKSSEGCSDGGSVPPEDES